ncbi:MAG: hypothetical protein U9Q07_03905 [Planctomycetota bacterium]|nr:hypothetical protein [Planctomycetota bacterium]
MKWKRKGGKDRAQAAGCQFVIAHVKDAWTARYCDRSGQWSEPVSKESKALAMAWCDDKATVEAQILVEMASLVDSRRSLAARFESMTPQEKSLIRLYRSWKITSEKERAELTKEMPYELLKSMVTLERHEKDSGVSL